MNVLMKALLLTGFVFALNDAGAQLEGSRFSGSSIHAIYLGNQKPDKSKQTMVIDLQGGGVCNGNIDGISMMTGNWQALGPNVYIKMQHPSSYLITGRLVSKGKPGLESALSGVLTYTLDGYAGHFEDKVKLKREVP